MSNGITSEHFSFDELKCKCGCETNGCTQKLVDALESLRTEAASPITVRSAYRCPAHNTKVGGAKASEHMAGNAADIVIAGRTTHQMEDLAKKIEAFRGIGRDDYAGYIHVDVRPFPARWCYGPDGKWCKYYRTSEGADVGRAA